MPGGSIPAVGRIHQTSQTAPPPTRSAISERWDHPQQQVLQRIDVVDDTGEQIPAAERGEPRGR